MSTSHVPPPLHEIAPERLDQLKHHLILEVRAIDSGRTHGTRRIVTAALVLAALVGATSLLSTRVGADTASAAEIRSKIAGALNTSQRIRGKFSVRSRDPGAPPRGQHGCQNCRPIVPRPSKFVIGANGSYATITLPATTRLRNDIAFDAATGVETSFLSGYLTGVRLYVRATNVDPAVPSSTPETQLAAWAYRALTERSPRIDEVTFAGRPAWKLTLDFRPGERLYDDYGARIAITVDRETGLVLQVIQYAFDPNRWTSIETIRDLEISGHKEPGDFTVPRPAGVKEVAHDYGFRRVAVEDAVHIVGYQPLLPTNTNDRPLNDFAVAKTTTFRFSSVYRRAPVHHDIVSARYGTGLDTITVTTRRGTLSDLADVFELGGISAETVHLRGPLARADALVSTSPVVEPGRVAAFHKGLLIVVSAPSPSEAVAVASSLQRTR